MIRTPAFAMATALLSLGLGACSSAENDTSSGAVANQSDAAVRLPEKPAEAAPDMAAKPSVPTATADANMTAMEPPAIAPTPDEQMLDDASASGMTAHAARDESPVNETESAELPEQK